LTAGIWCSYYYGDWIAFLSLASIARVTQEENENSHTHPVGIDRPCDTAKPAGLGCLKKRDFPARPFSAFAENGLWDENGLTSAFCLV
jgi:hypothetical protein